MTPALADAQPVAPRTVLDLAMMVRLLCRKVSVLKGPNDALVERAFVLLRTHDLQGSPLRDDLPPAAPAQDVGDAKLRSMADHLLTATALTGAELIHIATALTDAAAELARLRAALDAANARAEANAKALADIEKYIRMNRDEAKAIKSAHVFAYDADLSIVLNCKPRNAAKGTTP